MESKIKEKIEKQDELPDSWWYRVYAAVIATTIIVVAALGYFSYYFSN